MQMQTNKGVWFKRIAISCGIAFCIITVFILVIPLFISENFVRQKVAQTLEDRFHHIFQVGDISFHWPNRIHISYLAIQSQGQNATTPIQCDDIQGALKLVPLLCKKIVVKNFSIRQINYKNRLLIDDLVTDKFSFKNGIASIHTRLRVNDGPTTVKGTIDLRQKKPVFAFLINAKDIHITQDVPILHLIPLCMVKDGEIGGDLSLAGYMRGNGLGKDVLNKNLTADMNFTIRDGYIRGNKLFSSLLEIVGVKDAFLFHSMEAVLQINDGKIYTPKMNIKGQLLSLDVSGMTELEGTISYNALVKFNKEHLGKDVEKIASLILTQDELPVEIRGKTKDPIISVKLPKDNLGQIIKGLVNDFLKNPKEKQKKER